MVFLNCLFLTDNLGFVLRKFLLVPLRFMADHLTHHDTTKINEVVYSKEKVVICFHQNNKEVLVNIKACFHYIWQNNRFSCNAESMEVIFNFSNQNMERMMSFR